MNVRLPPGDDLTVVFLPQTPAAEEIVALAREWTAGRLLRPACWSTAAQVSRLDSDPPTALTTVPGVAAVGARRRGSRPSGG